MYQSNVSFLYDEHSTKFQFNKMFHKTAIGASSYIVKYLICREVC